LFSLVYIRQTASVITTDANSSSISAKKEGAAIFAAPCSTQALATRLG